MGGGGWWRNFFIYILLRKAEANNIIYRPPLLVGCCNFKSKFLFKILISVCILYTAANWSLYALLLCCDFIKQKFFLLLFIVPFWYLLIYYYGQRVQQHLLKNAYELRIIFLFSPADSPNRSISSSAMVTSWAGASGKFGIWLAVSNPAKAISSSSSSSSST